MIAASRKDDRSFTEKLLDDWGRLSTPQFGQVVTWVLLAVCFVLGSLSFEMVPGERQGPTSVISWFPAAWRSSEIPFHAFRVCLWIGATAWLFRVGTPWSCWLTVIGFTGLWSMKMENTTNGAHIFNASNQLLIVQALWQTFFHKEISQAIRERRFWSTPLYPRWAFLLGLALLGLFHTYAGLAKFMHSGFGWANGVSLQLWVYWDGRPGSWTREIMINQRGIAWMLQWMTLIFESAGVLALFSRHLRFAIGLALVGFYCGVVLTFDYGFHFNLLLTALFHFGCEEWFPRRFAPRPQEQPTP